MVISNIVLTKDTRFIILSADIAFRGKSVQRGYIKISKKYEAFISNDASPFLAAVLLPCMKSRENIYIDGSVSAKLLENTDIIMNLVKKWQIGLSKVKIRCRETVTDKGKPQYV